MLSYLNKSRTVSFAILLAVFTFSNVPFSNAANNGPTAEMVNNEIRNRDHFSILLGDVSGSTRRQYQETKTSNGKIIEWSSGKNFAAARYGDPVVSGNGVWRVTELDVKDGVFTGSTTSFYENGVRSKTQCQGSVGSEANCVTASRKFCESFKAKNKDLGIAIQDEGTKSNILNLGRQCADFANYLQETLNPSGLLEGRERAERDENVVAADIDAISRLKDEVKTKSVKDAKLVGMDAWMDRDTKLGASTTGMRERADRLKQASTDLRSLSRLAYMCADVRFVEQYSGAGWQLQQNNSKSKSTTK